MAGALALAHLAERVFGLQPCELCLAARWPYYIGAPLALLIFLVPLSLSSAWRQLAAAGLCAVLLWSLYYGLYHSGIEYGWWPAPAECASSGAAVTKAEDLLSQLGRTKIVPCDAPSFRLFGVLSFANLNALLSAVLLTLNVAALVKSSLRGATNIG